MNNNKKLKAFFKIPVIKPKQEDQIISKIIEFYPCGFWEAKAIYDTFKSYDKIIQIFEESINHSLSPWSVLDIHKQAGLKNSIKHE